MIKKLKNFFLEKKAFSLFELALIVAVMSTTLTVAGIGWGLYGRSSKDSDSAKTVQYLQNAILSYFAENGYIPCPADPTLPIENINFGTERFDTTGTGCSGEFMSSIGNQPRPLQNQSRSPETGNYFLFGSVPVRTLGLPDSIAFDAYGNRITYVIHDSFANYKRHSDPIYQNALGYSTLIVLNSKNIKNHVLYQNCSCSLQPFIALFGDSSKNTGSPDRYRRVMTTCNIQIKNNLTDLIIQSTKDNIAFVLISSGKNGYGAWSYNGTLNKISVNPMEAANSYAYYVNSSGSYTTNYVFDITGTASVPISFYSGNITNTFGHYVSYILSRQLFLIKEKGTNNRAIYCHISTHPGFLEYTGSGINNGGRGCGNGYIIGDQLQCSLIDLDVASEYYRGQSVSIPECRNGDIVTLNSRTATCNKFGVWV